MKKRGGFTLIEVTIMIAILGVIIFLASDTYYNSINASTLQFYRSELSTDARTVLDGMMSNIKMGSDIEETYDIYTSDATHLILALPAIDASNNFIYNGEQTVLDRIIYYVDGTSLHKLVISVDANSRLYSQNNVDKVLLSNVKTLQFDYVPDPPNTVQVNINLTVQNTNLNPFLEFNITAKGVLRNV